MLLFARKMRKGQNRQCLRGTNISFARGRSSLFFAGCKPDFARDWCRISHQAPTEVGTDDDIVVSPSRERKGDEP